MVASHGLEALISHLGGRSKFQIIIHILAAYTYITLVFNHVIMAFHGTLVPHTCKAGGDLNIDNSSVAFDLVRDTELINVSHSKCSSALSFMDGKNTTVTCLKGQWEYSPRYQEWNIVSQFDLVCDNQHLANLATTIYFVGVMVGGLVFGDLADRFGRLPIMLLTLYSSVFLGIITAFSVNYSMFVTLRFVTGILMQGLQTSAYTLIMELYVTKYRPFAGAVTECFFGAAIMLLAGLAFFVKDWRHLQIAISLPGILTVFYPWVVPESLRWLVMKRKLEKAETLIHRICRINKIFIPKDTWEKLKKESCMEASSGQPQSQQQYTIIDVFRTSHIRQRSLILFYIWFAISTSYYGLTFQMTIFTGSRYLIFFIGGAVETVAYALTLPVMRRFGRKKPLLACCIAAAVLCVAAGIISDCTNDLGSVTIGLALAGRCAVAGLFGIIFVYTSEIYPTVIRNIGMGACCLWARAGGVVAPQINQWTKNLWGVDALVIFGVMVLVAGLSLFPLPETHNCQLPDSLKEAEEDPAKKHQTECNRTIAPVVCESEAEKADLLLIGGDVLAAEIVDEHAL